MDSRPVTIRIGSAIRSHRPSTAVSHGPRSGLRQKPARNGPGGGATSDWFPWARVAVPELESFARLSGFRVMQLRVLRGRWFARLQLA